MPILKNTRHERFAMELAIGKTAEEAYRNAGYVENRSNAARLLNANETIRSRVAELLTELRSKSEVTLESLQRDADAIYARAMAMGQLSAASGALKLKAVFAGLYIEKADVTNRSVDASSLPDEKLAELAGAAIEQHVPALDPTPREESEQLN